MLGDYVASNLVLQLHSFMFILANRSFRVHTSAFLRCSGLPNLQHGNIRMFLSCLRRLFFLIRTHIPYAHLHSNMHMLLLQTRADKACFSVSLSKVAEAITMLNKFPWTSFVCQILGMDFGRSRGWRCGIRGLEPRIGGGSFLFVSCGFLLFGFSKSFVPAFSFCFALLYGCGDLIQEYSGAWSSSDEESL
ncbi:hypothetical protein BDP27DRAFT_533446 [Rhodocollybia butyracea]|uniref:Uncharacterized protein n=1 Tax=Rhodocollybia butyracea TaxID=206335 RepID=A0A9P5PRZ4_9AGAR|nr:hypothetical protein BDP27DRAFT_533446 [Rhodocollybia butyracea]